MAGNKKKYIKRDLPKDVMASNRYLNNLGLPKIESGEQSALSPIPNPKLAMLNKFQM